MAALIAAAAAPVPDFPLVSLSSEGVTLVYGRDERAIEAAKLLADHLDVTVLLSRPKRTSAPARYRISGRQRHDPLRQGPPRRVRADRRRFRAPAPSSRGMLTFGTPRNGAVSRCDLDHRSFRRRAAVSRARPARRLSARRPGRCRRGAARRAQGARPGRAFDKPRYIDFTAELCAHSRSNIVGCRRCLDLCPTGAITPAGNHVAIDPNVCAGCGQCAAVCPTGAAAYALPPADALLRKLRTLLTTYREAGGTRAVVLLHDQPHGFPLIEALARHGDGLPANVLPLSVNEVTQVGLEAVAATFAYGASALRFLIRAKAAPRCGRTAQDRCSRRPDPRGPRVRCGPRLDHRDRRPVRAWRNIARDRGVRWRAASRRHSRRSGQNATCCGWRCVNCIMRRRRRSISCRCPTARRSARSLLNVEGCTLCLSCVSACPTGALSDDQERPLLRFAEDACVQCGLCKATCPEKVITLRPQLDFRAATAPARVLKQEEPFCCIRCAKPFGVKSSVERVAAKLEGKHWMFQNSAKRLDVIKMCADCRVIAMSEEKFDPFGAPRPPGPAHHGRLSARAGGEGRGLITSSPWRENPSAPCGPLPNR